MFTSYVSQQCYALPHGENRRTLYWGLSTDINKENSREKRKWMYVSPLYPISAKGRGRCVEILFQKQGPQFSDKIFYWGLKNACPFFQARWNSVSYFSRMMVLFSFSANSLKNQLGTAFNSLIISGQLSDPDNQTKTTYCAVLASQRGFSFLFGSPQHQKQTTGSLCFVLVHRNMQMPLLDGRAHMYSPH